MFANGINSQVLDNPLTSHRLAAPAADAACLGSTGLSACWGEDSSDGNGPWKIFVFTN